MTKQKDCWGLIYKLVGWSVASWAFGLFFHPFGTPTPDIPPAYLQQASETTSALPAAIQSLDAPVSDTTRTSVATQSFEATPAFGVSAH